MKLDLDFSGQNKTSLEGIDLTRVTELICDFNDLEELAPLPQGLKILQCANNKLKRLPTLPDSLEELWCNNNILTELPDLPNGLKVLICSFNPLMKIKYLPESIVKLSINYSEILPDIPWNFQYIDRMWKYDIYEQYDKKCKYLGITPADNLPRKEEWDRVNQLYLEKMYKPENII